MVTMFGICFDISDQKKSISVGFFFLIKIFHIYNGTKIYGKAEDQKKEHKKKEETKETDASHRMHGGVLGEGVNECR